MFHILIVGAGTMGNVHNEAYRRMEDVKVIGVIDTKLVAVRELEQTFTCPIFHSMEEALQSIERIDVIDICTPTTSHLEYVKKAADVGLNIICEKPIARSLAEAEEINRYCKEKGVRLFIAHVLRFFPEYVRAKQMIDDQVVGPIALARMTRSGSFPKGRDNWYSDRTSSGGLILDMLIHDIDFLRWCFGDVERIFARSNSGDELGELEYALVIIRFKNGVIAHLEGSWAHASFSMKFEFAGVSGVIDYDSAIDKPLEFQSRVNIEGNKAVDVPESPLNTSPYYRELRHFLDCITNSTVPIVTADDAIAAMRIALSAIESIETSSPVTLN